MSRLAVLQEALFAFALSLHAHGPACVCAACQACQGALALYGRLDHVLAILEAWARGEADEWLQPEDIGMLLRMLDSDRAAPPRAAGEGER